MPARSGAPRPSPSIARTLFLSAAAAALLAGCAPPRGLTSGPMRGATDADIAAGLLRLEDRREYDAEFVASAARHASPDVRRRAAYAAGRIRDKRGIPVLGRLLGDADTAVAAVAAFGLGQTADTTAVPLLAPYVAAARIAAMPTVVGEAAYALAKIPHPRARAALEALLRDAPRTGPGVREAVGSALLGIWRQGRPLPIEAISPWLTSDDAELRWRAAYSLARRADPRGTAALFPRARDADPLVRSFVARSLGRVMADSAGIGGDAALNALIVMVRDADPAVRVNAVRSLGGYEHVRAVFALNDLVTQTRDPYVAITAAESLQRLGAKGVYGSSGLRTAATDARRPVALRTAALIALGDVAPDEALDIADGLARESGWRYRAAAARVYATHYFGRDRAAALARDPDGRVAAAAVEASLATLGDTILPPREMLLGALSHPDVVVRTNALGGIAKLNDPSLLPRVLDAYQAAQADTLNDAALAAVDAVAELAKQDRAAAAAFFARFPRSADYLVRQRVHAAFGDTLGGSWGAPLPIETGTEMEEYRRVVAGSMARPRPHAVIVTDRGEIEVELFAAEAPLTVRSFLTLAERGFFDGQDWPRVVPNFVIQGGDPRGDTSGGPGYSLRDELNPHRYGRGTLGMALSGPDTGGSQWFITHSPQPHLDGTYTVFGRVVRGMDVADRILPGDRIIRIREID